MNALMSFQAVDGGNLPVNLSLLLLFASRNLQCDHVSDDKPGFPKKY